MLFEFNTRGVAQILETAGADFVVIDMEHSSFTISEAANLISWFKATPITPIVRIPEVQYHHIARVMDAGALGVAAPNVRTAEEARRLVNAAKYVPVGKRGLFHGGANSDYRGCPVDGLRAYMDRANENTTVICMIESPEGIENLEAIAATPGIDALWVGWADLAQYMGLLGQMRDRRLIDAIQQTVDTAKRHHLAAMIQPNNLAQLAEWIGFGFNAISFGGDCFVYRDAMTQAFAAVRKAVAR